MNFSNQKPQVHGIGKSKVACNPKTVLLLGFEVPVSDAVDLGFGHDLMMGGESEAMTDL